MNQKSRVAIANDTLQLLEQGYYVNSIGSKVDLAPTMELALNNTRLFIPDELTDILENLNGSKGQFSTSFEVTNETTLDAVRRLAADGMQHVMCLNFASAKNPGGGFLGGAVAQEECIARASGLYPCLLKAPEYYSFHRKQGSCLYSDHMIYSPGVPVFKYENGALQDQFVTTAIVTSPAVNAGVVTGREQENAGQIIPAMRIRIKKLLALCLHYKHETLVLGAWGCGVFRNNPEDIAGLFKEALQHEFAGRFKKIVFAVKTNNESIIAPFRIHFL